MDNKPKCELIGEDGNIYNLMLIAAETLKKNNQKQLARELRSRITNGEAKSYEMAISIISEYVEIC